MSDRTIVGCDSYPASDDAVVLGQALASALGGGISLVGVFPPSLFPVPEVSDRQTLRAQTEAILARARDRWAPEAAIESIPDTSVPQALRHFAERWHARTVVLG